MGVKVLDFHAEWCGPCEVQDPIIDELSEDWEDDDSVVIEKVDVDNQEQVAQNFQVRSIPTVVVLKVDDDSETEHERFVGVTDKEDIQESINEAM